MIKQLLGAAMMIAALSPLHGFAEVDLAKATQRVPLSDFSQGDYFICLPLPCPSNEIYTKARDFVDQIAIKNDKSNPYQIVLVIGDWLNGPNNAGHQAAVELTKRYAVLDGIHVVGDLDSDVAIDAGIHGTPWAVFYHNGKKLWSGAIWDGETIVDATLAGINQQRLKQ